MSNNNEVTVIKYEELHKIFVGTQSVINGHGAATASGIMSAYWFPNDLITRYVDFNLTRSVDKGGFYNTNAERIEETAEQPFLCDNMYYNFNTRNLVNTAPNLKYIKLLGKGSSINAYTWYNCPLLEEARLPYLDLSSYALSRDTSRSPNLKIVECNNASITWWSYNAPSVSEKVIIHGSSTAGSNVNSFGYWTENCELWLISENEEDMFKPYTGITYTTKPARTIKCKTQALCDYCASLWATANPNFIFEVLTEEELNDCSR